MRLKELLFGGLLITIAATLAYYVFVYLPHKDMLLQKQTAVANKAKEEANDLSMQQKCRDAGEKAYKQTYLDENFPPTQSVEEPEYYYNKDLNKCLYSYMIMSRLDSKDPQDNGLPWSRFVKDSLTNQTVLVYFHNVNDKSEESKKRMMDYFTQRDKLMGVNY